MESTLRLFKALPVDDVGCTDDDVLMQKTIKQGFIFSPKVIAHYNASELGHLTSVVSNLLTLTGEQMNSSFHKSWQKVRDASMEQLVLEQIIHYFTTYGYERLGIYSEDTVYIPAEELDIPELDEKGLRLIVIRGLTKEELKKKLLDLLGLGVALAEDTVRDVIDVATCVGVSSEEVGETKNKEVRIALYDYLDMFPASPVEFLRYMVYKATNKTLLIKNAGAIEEIKAQDNLAALGLLEKYRKKYGLERLAEIFYRFKPLFLAFRTGRKLKTTVNRIRKLAVKHHKPMPEDYLNTVTGRIKNGETINLPQLQGALAKANTFRKIRLAYALKFRTRDTESIVYRIRNGKSYATNFEFNNHDEAERVLGMVLNSIAESIDVKGEKIYIPPYIGYSLPATEKQFTGYFPSGTCVVLPKDMIAGIHWNNLKGHRVDLDLSLTSIGGKIGWDTSYRTSNGNVLFSGDITDARGKNGASELFYIKKQEPQAFVMMVNYFNHQDGDKEVPFKILVAHEKVNKDFEQNYTVDPNNVMAIASTKIKEKQKMLGLLVTDTDECRFYFVEGAIGKSITSYSHAPYVRQAREYMLSYYRNSIQLVDVLARAGAVFVEAEEADIDLSPEKLEKDTMLNLVKGKPCGS